ncbi:MAG TPA: CHAT domain-containing protein [Anaerolineae bacterium]|nr:CHAT domain-containing protein [Anaerolineae bacterium]
MNDTPLQIVLRFRQQIARAIDFETYQVEVLRAPGRGWGGPLVPGGLSDSLIQAVRDLYRSYLKRQRAAGGSAVSEGYIEPLRSAGNQLFQALPETIQTRLRLAQAIAGQVGRSLELVLVFDLSAQPLAALPWELLHDPDDRYFYALRGGVVRQMSSPAVAWLDPVDRPRSILGLWAEPDDVASLAVRKRYAPAPGRNAGITWLEGSNSLNRLEKALATGSFDGLHIVAHGRAGEGWSDLSLAFAGAEGHAQWLNPDQLATFVAGYPALRFLYLDVCSSGDTPGKEFVSGGLARQLVGNGVSIVVAMQDEISQDAAGLMAHVFYREWAQGAAVGQAVSAARRAVRIQQDDPAHWSVPILYVQQRAVGEHSPMVDGILDRVRDFLNPSTLAFLALLLWVGRLSFAFAQIPSDASTEWPVLAPLIAESILLSGFATFAMRHDQKQVGEKYSLSGRQWLEVLVHKHEAGFIWGWMMWILIWLVWLGVNWAGLGGRLDAGLRQMIWAVGLLGLAGASYTGARQAIRQKLLFMRIGRSPVRIGDWFLLFAMAFLPLGLALLLSTVWSFLAATTGGFYLVLSLLILIVIATGRMSRES